MKPREEAWTGDLTLRNTRIEGTSLGKNGEKERKKKKVMIPLISLKPATQRNRGSHERGSIGLKWQDLEAGSAQQSPVLQEGQMRLGVKMSFGQRGNVTLMHTVSLERQ